MYIYFNLITIATHLPDPIENSCTVTTSTVTTSIVTTSMITTSIVSTSVMQTPVQFADQKSDNCQKELISAIIVPVIIILIFLILSVTILIIYITWKGKGYDYTYASTYVQVIFLLLIYHQQKKCYIERDLQQCIIFKVTIKSLHMYT